MNFYYHPILGLQLTFGTGLIVLDLDSLPDVSSFNTEEFMKLLRKQGISLMNSTGQDI